MGVGFLKIAPRTSHYRLVIVGGLTDLSDRLMTSLLEDFFNDFGFGIFRVHLKVIVLPKFDLFFKTESF